MEHPRPCFIVSLKTSLPRLPPPPGAFRASSRPLHRGRAVIDDSPDTVHGEQERDLEGDPPRGWLPAPLPGGVSMRNRHPGGGADGEGGGTSPSPVPACHRERFSWSTPASPVTRVSPGTVFVEHPRLPARSAPPPAPSRGGGQCMMIVRIQCTGAGRGFRLRVFTLTAERGSLSLALYRWGITPLGVGLTGRGVEHPPPLSLACHRERCSSQRAEPPPAPCRTPKTAPASPRISIIPAF